MKPNTRILDYVTLIQDGILTLDDVPQDVQKEVTKWLRYLSGVENDGMVKDTAEADPEPTQIIEPKTETKPVLNDPVLPKPVLDSLTVTKKAGE